MKVRILTVGDTIIGVVAEDYTARNLAADAEKFGLVIKSHTMEVGMVRLPYITLAEAKATPEMAEIKTTGGSAQGVRHGQ